MIYSFEYMSDVASKTDWQRKVEVTIKVEIEKIVASTPRGPTPLQYVVGDWEVTSIHAEDGEDLHPLYLKDFDLFKEVALQVDGQHTEIIAERAS